MSNDKHVETFFNALERTAQNANINMFVKGLIIEEIINAAFLHPRLKPLAAEKDAAKTVLKVLFDMVGNGKSLTRALEDQGYAKHMLRNVTAEPALKAYWATWMNACRHQHENE